MEHTTILTITIIVTTLITLSALAGIYSAYRHLVNAEIAQLLPTVKVTLKRAITLIIIPLTLLSVGLIAFGMYWAYLKFTDNGDNVIALLVLVLVQYILTMTSYYVIVDKVTTATFKRIEKDVEKVTEQ